MKIKNFLKPTIPEASHRGTSPTLVIPVRTGTGRTGGFRRADSYRYHFGRRGQKPKFYILPHPKLPKKAVPTSPKER
jgi:hypothetical protein